MKSIKKIISGVLCATMVLSLSGCSSCFVPFGSKKADDDILTEAKKTNVNAVFKETDSFAIDMDYISNVRYLNGQYVVIGEDYSYLYDDDVTLYEKGGVNYNSSAVVVGNGNDDEEFPEEGETPDDAEGETPDDSEGEIPADEEGEIPADDLYDDDDYIKWRIAFYTDGNNVTYREADIEGTSLYESSVTFDDDGNCYFVSERYDEDSEEYYLWAANPDFTQLRKVELNSNEGDYLSINRMVVDKNGNIVIQGYNTFMIYDKNLQRIDYEVAGEDLWYNDLYITKDKQVYVVGYKYEKDSSVFVAYTVNENNKLTEIENETLKEFINCNSVMGNCYDFLYMTATSIWGINMDGEAVEIVNFLDSDINPNDMGQCIFIDEEHFFSLIYDDEGAKIVNYEKVPADQVKERKIVTIGVEYLDYDFTNYVISYNKSQDEYRFRVVDYSEFDTVDDYEAGNKRFKSDLVSGNACDIIIPGSYEIDNLIEKGVFADLTPLLDESEGFKKSDLVANCQNTFARDGKLYAIFPTFYVYTNYMLAENYKEGMTIDDVIAWEKATGNRALSDYTTKEEVFSNMIYYNIDNYLDVKTGKCNFDSPEFIAALKYADTYKSQEDLPDDYYMDYDWYAEQSKVGSGEILQDMIYIESAWSYWGSRYECVRDKDIAFCTYLGASGNPGHLGFDNLMGISASSENKDIAVKFIKYVFEQTNRSQYSWGFSSLQSEFDEQIMEGTRKRTWTDFDGKEYEDDYVIWVNNEEIVVDPMTEEDAKELKEFLTSVTNVSYYDEGITGIITEEAEAFFAGQKTAEEVAKVIQSRVKIYVNEKK